MSKYDAPDYQSNEAPTEETNEAPETPTEESAEVSQEFRDRVDELVAGATPEELEYMKSCCGDTETPENFDVEGLPE
jgi:heterodisulfide reductase subunit B